MEIEKYFGGNDVSIVNTMLSEYDGPEKERVKSAILKLSQGSVDGIKYHLECAMKDYRDVLYWVENPDEAEEGFKKLIGGMTVNERLYHLNMFDEFDMAVSEGDENKLRLILGKCLLSEENINELVSSKINT